MSVKAMSLVWDFECPSTINGHNFKPNHKYILMAYADHADHNGKNIYPAVETIARKTGYDARTVQRITDELNAMCILLDDGHGPRGTNRWQIPFSERGDKLSPLTNCQGDKSTKSLGDIPSGDIPSGDKLSPELKEPEPKKSISIKSMEIWDQVLETLKVEKPKAQFETWIAGTTPLTFDGSTLTVAVRNSYTKDFLTNRIKARAQELCGHFVNFVVAKNDDEDDE